MATQFSETDVVLRCGIVTDTHLGRGRARFEESIRQFYQMTEGEKLDVIFAAGDLTDNGLPYEIESVKEALDALQIEKKGTEFVFALGNHDLEFDRKPYNGEVFKEILGDYAYRGASPEEIRNGNHHIVVGGFHFIALNCKVYNGGCHHALEDLEWLRGKLEDAVKDAPNQPIFLATHPLIEGTVYGSNEGRYWSSNNLDGVLKDYPQVVVFGGHLHFPLHDRRNLIQKDYTAAAAGCTLYCSLESQLEGVQPLETAGGMETADCQDFSQGLYLEVDRANNVRITRVDFLNQALIGQPWIIGAPQADKSHLKKYTYEKLVSQNQAPYFEPNAQSRIIRLTPEILEIEFDAALDDDYVYYYEIHLLEAHSGRAVGDTHVVSYSDFYRYPSPDMMSRTCKRSINLEAFGIPEGSIPAHKQYVVEVIAVDSFGAKSGSLTSSAVDVGQ